MSYTLTELFTIKNDKSAFKRIMRWIHSEEKPDEVSLAKTVSSVITHILIEMEGSDNKEEAKDKAKGYRLDDWIIIQKNLVFGDITVSGAFSQIEEMLNENRF